MCRNVDFLHSGDDNRLVGDVIWLPFGLDLYVIIILITHIANIANIAPLLAWLVSNSHIFTTMHRLRRTVHLDGAQHVGLNA